MGLFRSKNKKEKQSIVVGTNGYRKVSGDPALFQQRIQEEKRNPAYIQQLIQSHGPGVGKDKSGKDYQYEGLRSFTGDLKIAGVSIRSYPGAKTPERTHEDTWILFHKKPKKGEKKHKWFRARMYLRWQNNPNGGFTSGNFSAKSSMFGVVERSNYGGPNANEAINSFPLYENSKIDFYPQTPISGSAQKEHKDFFRNRVKGWTLRELVNIFWPRNKFLETATYKMRAAAVSGTLAETKLGNCRTFARYFCEVILGIYKEALRNTVGKGHEGYVGNFVGDISVSGYVPFRSKVPDESPERFIDRRYRQYTETINFRKLDKKIERTETPYPRKHCSRTRSATKATNKRAAKSRGDRSTCTSKRRRRDNKNRSIKVRRRLSRQRRPERRRRTLMERLLHGNLV